MSPDDKPKKPVTRRFERPVPPPRPRNDDDTDDEDTTEPLPPELAAFARDPQQAAKILKGMKRNERDHDPNEETEELKIPAERPPPPPPRPTPRSTPQLGGVPAPRVDKSHQPIQTMRPSDVGAAATNDGAKLSRLLEINKAINNERDLGKLLDTIMDAAIELSRARRGFLVLWDRGEMQIVRARNIERSTITTPESSISRHLIREAIDRRETVVTARASTDRAEYASATGLDLKSVAVSPLMSRGRVLGAIYLDDPDRVGMFQDTDLRSLEAFCDQAAIALQNARYVAELETRMESQRLKLRRVEAEVRKRDEDDVRRFGNLITKSPKLKRVFELLARVAETAFPVIIQGESGTGKELLAKAIHYSSDRKEQPFVPINCASVPETLLDSELFGYQAGAFTGAVRGHRGLFEQADKGTLFLDEIEEMSPAMQGKLLRVLQEGEVRRVGGKATVKVDVRVIAATNRDIQEMVEKGDFRRDLYYRLNVIPVTIPPLRERLEDLQHLVDDLLGRLAEANQQPPTIDAESVDCLRRYPWPGNIRELENELKRLLALGTTRIRVVDLDARISTPEARRPSQSLPNVAGSGGADRNEESGSLPTLNIKELEKITIERALQASNGNKTHAAKLLGLSRRGLLKKLERYRAEGEHLAGDIAPEADEAEVEDVAPGEDD